MIPTRPRGPSVVRRALRTLSAVTVAALAIGASTALGITAASAAPNAAISLNPLANASAPHGQFDPFQYSIDFSCSGASGAGCAGMQIRVPVTLEPRAGQVERFDSWTMSAQLSASSSGSFTQAWESSGSTRTLVLTARNTIPAGVQESLALTIQPPSWVGDDVRFTVGGARLTTTNGDPATSQSHTSSVTNIPLHQPSLRMTGGFVPSQASNVQIVSYAFDPMMNNIITQAGATHVFGLGDVHSPTSGNVTAQYESIELSVEIPQGGRVSTPVFNSTPGLGNGPSVPSYQTVVNGNTLMFTLPPNRLPTDVIQFTVEYPAEMAGESVCVTGQRSFMASNGDQDSEGASTCHLLDMRPIPDGQIGKCGHGGVPMNGMHLLGMCSSSVMVPDGWTTEGLGGQSTGRYVVKMTEMREGDTVSFTDFMPCLDTPGTSVLTESFASQEVCAAPAVRITSVSAGVEPSNSRLLQGITDHVSYQLVNNDGTITSPITAITAPFPVPPATGHWTGIRLKIEHFPRMGTAIGTIHVEALPGVDREMMLENYTAGEVVRAANGAVNTYETSPVGVIRVVDIVSATARSNIGHSAGSAFATVSGSYTMGRLDPGVALPVHTLRLPAGFDLQNGSLSSFTVQYNGAGARVALTDHYSVTVVPEDTAAGTGPRLVMTPIPGTPAIPTNGAGWPTVSVQGRIAPTWGEWNSRQSVTAAISVHGDARQIASCTAGATRVGVDLADRDGDGVRADDVSCEWSTSAMLGIPNAAASAAATKGVRNTGDTTWETGTTPIRLTSGSMEYLLSWRNAGQPTLDDVVLYDLLPQIGDAGATSVTAGESRGSTFEPRFTGIVGAIPAGMSIAYSASANPCRPEVMPTNPGCDDDWVQDPADLGGNGSVTALRVTLPGAHTTGSIHSVVFGMEVPTEAMAGDIAWNTVAHRATLSGQPMSPAETARVGAVVPSNVQLSKTASTNEAEDWEFEVGDAITYTLEAFNEFGAGVENVILTDDLSEVLAHATFNGDARASTGTVNFDEGTQTLRWTGDLGPRERATITYSVTGTSPSTAFLMNSVVGTANDEPTNCVTGEEHGCFVFVNFTSSPAISIDKVSTNVTEGDALLSGTLVAWDYIITNTGSEELRIDAVTDSRGVEVDCAERLLPIGESTICTGQGRVAGDPSYTNVGAVTAVGTASLRTVVDSDAWTTPIEQLSAALEVFKSAEGIEEGEVLEPNQRVTWKYTVTNTGTDTIESVTVSDDRGVRVDCPNPVHLAPAASVTCTGSGSVGYADFYTNVAIATGIGGSSGETVTASDSWSATVRQPAVGLQIDKVGLGVAETDTVRRGTVVTWEYRITNAGDEPIGTILVTDDQGVAVSCPAGELPPGSEMTCTGSGSVGSAERYTNVGVVTGTSTLTGRDLSAADPWSVTIRDLIPELTVVKGATNAVGGGSILAGSTVDWNYTVQNTGEEALRNLVVVDDQGVAVECPVTELAVGEITTCTGSERIGNVGSYTNVATATGDGVETGISTQASDVWATAVEEPTTATTISKSSTEYEHGSSLAVDSQVTWEYEITNTGSETLVSLLVTDDQGVVVECPADTLEPGASMTCTGSGSVGNSASYTNTGTVRAVGEVTGHETSSEDSWTVSLVPATDGADPEGPVGVEWPDTPVDGQPVDPSSLLAVTGGAGREAFAAAGLAALLLGLVLLRSQRRRVLRRRRVRR